MKRILAFICVMACLCGLCLPAMATGDMVTVTAQVPEDWADANLYVWGDNGALVDWPGTAMTKGDDGRYTAEIPCGYNMAIINTNGGETKTQDMEVDPISNFWTVVNGSTGMVYYEDPGIVDLTDMPLSMLALIGTFNGWNVGDTTYQLSVKSENIYTAEMELYKDKFIEFKVVGNGSWDSGFNYGAAEGQNVLVAGTAVAMVNGSGTNLTYTTTQDCKLTFTVDMTDSEAPTVKVEETPADLEPLPEEVMVKVYASVPESVTAPNLWAWSVELGNKNAFDAWPGVAMTKEGDWWVMEVPNWVDSVIINDGTSQTLDLSVVTVGQDIWVVVDESWGGQTFDHEPSEDDLKPQPAPAPTTPAPAPTTGTDPSDNADKGAARTKALIILGTALLAIIAVAFVLSLPKKIK